MLCVTIRIVCPLALISVKSLSSEVVERESKAPPVGSSAKINRGSVIRARAIAALCFSPPPIPHRGIYSNRCNAQLFGNGLQPFVHLPPIGLSRQNKGQEDIILNRKRI